MRNIIIGSIFVVFTSSALAENIVNTQTNTWKSIPITVDSQKHTYSTPQGFLVPEGNYYYTYSGYRCLINKVDNAGAEPIVYKDKNVEGKSIYCYPE